MALLMCLVVSWGLARARGITGLGVTRYAAGKPGLGPTTVAGSTRGDGNREALEAETLQRHKALLLAKSSQVLLAKVSHTASQIQGG